ncbi:sulfate permease family domain-containing protein [Phthorimaea operculella]|nr:sulfate permease family domain-containing protein [Phthorimaea operculella]
MDSDDPRTPLLGHTSNSRLHRTARKLCGLESWRRRLPITVWLPKYKWDYLLRDAIAGITVGLTSIPQGIAYAIVAGVPPQVGLYSSAFPGIVYAVFGSCKDVTVGPTAILAALLAKYVAISVDFAYLAAFLSGCIILLLGVLQLGFLLDFISKPVISGFTTAAALQIAAAQLKSLFRISGKSGNTCISALTNFFENIKTVHLWDTVLGVSSIVVLYLMKSLSLQTTDSAPAWHRFISRSLLYLVRARNAIVVFVATGIAYCLYTHKLTPFKLTGTIEGGLPHFGPPPFSTVIDNKPVGLSGMLAVFGAEGLVMPLVAILESIAIAKAFGKSLKMSTSIKPSVCLSRWKNTAHFGPPPFSTVIDNKTVGLSGMLAVFGAEGLVMPLVAILESIAIAKAFAGSTAVDATQEMLAIGSCNILASFCQSMPATGSFTRTALNHASGVVTPAGSLFKASLVLLAVTLLSSAFYFIPRSALAAVIMVAMVSIIDLGIVKQLWRNSKIELLVYMVTLLVGACAGLEYGILCGAACDALRAMASIARPPIHERRLKIGNLDCISITLVGSVSYASAQYTPDKIRELVPARSDVVILDARQLRNLDNGVAEYTPDKIRELVPARSDVVILDARQLRNLDNGVAEYTPDKIRELVPARSDVVILDARQLRNLDNGVAENLVCLIEELSQRHHVLLWNFPDSARRLLEDFKQNMGGRFVTGPSIDQHILGLEIQRRDYGLNHGPNALT